MASKYDNTDNVIGAVLKLIFWFPIAVITVIKWIFIDPFRSGGLKHEKSDAGQKAEVQYGYREKPVRQTEESTLKKQRMGGKTMATVLRAGKYVFGEDIPLGKYNLKAIYGTGELVFPRIMDGEWEEDSMEFGVEEGDAKTYYGLSLPKGKYFEITGNIELEITRSKMIEIE